MQEQTEIGNGPSPAAGADPAATSAAGGSVAVGSVAVGSAAAGSAAVKIEAVPSKINHLGIAVRDLEEALLVWRDGLGLTLLQVVELPERGLRVAFLPCGEAMIELLAPLHDQSEISKFLSDRGPGIHHVCLQTADLGEASARAEAAGMRLLGEGPKLGAEGFPVRFAHPKSTGGALVELLELARQPE